MAQEQFDVPPEIHRMISEVEVHGRKGWQLSTNSGGGYVLVNRLLSEDFGKFPEMRLPKHRVGRLCSFGQPIMTSQMLQFRGLSATGEEWARSMVQHCLLGKTPQDSVGDEIAQLRADLNAAMTWIRAQGGDPLQAMSEMAGAPEAAEEKPAEEVVARSRPKPGEAGGPALPDGPGEFGKPEKPKRRKPGPKPKPKQPEEAVEKQS